MQFQETLAVRGEEQIWVNTATKEEAVLWRELFLINREEHIYILSIFAEICSQEASLYLGNKVGVIITLQMETGEKQGCLETT